MRITIAISILICLFDGGLHSAAELSERFEVSRRSVYRYMDCLLQAGVPVESVKGRYGGWRIAEKYRLSGTFLTREEYSRLLFAIQSHLLTDDVGKSLYGKVKSLGSGAYGGAILQSDQLVVAATVGGDAQRKLDALKYAIVNRFFAEIEYHSKEGVTTRTVEPYCFILKDGFWYVLCFCRLRNDFRYFRVSRITGLTVSDRHFKPRNFKVDVEFIDTGAVSGKESAEILLTVSPAALSKVEEWLGFDKTAKLGDSYVVRAEVPLDEYTVNRILSCGSDVVVEKPESLRRAVAEKCRTIASCYADSQ